MSADSVPSVGMPAARNIRAAPWRDARPPSAPRALRFFYQHLFEHLDIQRLIRHQPFQPLVFLLQLLQPPRLRDFQVPYLLRHL